MPNQNYTFSSKSRKMDRRIVVIFLYKFNKYQCFIFLFLLQLCLWKGNETFSQSRNNFIPYTSIGGGFGTANYYGDLAPLNSFISSTSNSLRWGIGIDATRYFTKNLGVSLELAWIRLGADDFHSSNLETFARNLHFRNDVKEVSIAGKYFPISLKDNFTRRDKIIPNISLGIGYFFHNPVARVPSDAGSNWVNLQPLNTEGQGLNVLYGSPYKLSGFCIPVGIGARFKYNPEIDISFDLSYRFVFTDYLDDIGGIYPNTLFFKDNLAKSLSRRVDEISDGRTGDNREQKLLQLLNNDGITTTAPFDEIATFGATGADRGSVKGNDSYLTVFIKIRYLISDGIKCPKIR